MSAPTSDGRPIYLDHNATTPVLPEVRNAMLPYLGERFGNPSSAHDYGRQARKAVEKARIRVAALVGASPEEIVFTSGGTEANNLAIRGVAAGSGPGKHLVTSVVEHPATEEPCRLLERRGWEVTRLPVDETGRVRTRDADEAVTGRTELVTLMHANNETGTVQPVTQAARAAHAVGAVLHTDAAQTVGKVPVDVDELDVDLLSLAGHKLYAPKGVGALYVRKGTAVEPLLRGAGHEGGLRPGTENVASIVGLGAACEIALATLEEEGRRVRKLRDLFWTLLVEAVPDLSLNGHPEDRLPNTLNVRFPNALGSEILTRAPQLAASTGSACHEGGERPSVVLTAMGIGAETALGSIRFSLGRETTEEDVRQATAAIVDAWKRAHSPGPRSP